MLSMKIFDGRIITTNDIVRISRYQQNILTDRKNFYDFRMMARIDTLVIILHLCIFYLTEIPLVSSGEVELNREVPPTQQLNLPVYRQKDIKA